MRDKRFIYFLDRSNFMKKILVIKIVALFVIVLSTAFFVSCEGIDLTPPTDDELRMENWTVSEVKYYPSLNDLTVFIEGTQYISSYKYFTDIKLTNNVDFANYININGRTLTYSEVFHTSGSDYIYDLILFSKVDPPLDPIENEGIVAMFVTVKTTAPTKVIETGA